jgi:hypothetical protein
MHGLFYGSLGVHVFLFRVAIHFFCHLVAVWKFFQKVFACMDFFCSFPTPFTFVMVRSKARKIFSTNHIYILANSHVQIQTLCEEPKETMRFVSFNAVHNIFIIKWFIILFILNDASQQITTLLYIKRACEHGRTGRKKLGGQKEICPTFSDCARLLPKNRPAPPPPNITN